MGNLLQKWEQSHKQKILNELKQASLELTIENIPKIIKETSFKVRSKKHSKECPYYQLEYSCHPKIKDLNCFLCACPNYKSGLLIGGCKINSRRGKLVYHSNLPKRKVWDCSDCTINHTPKEVETYLRKLIKS